MIFTRQSYNSSNDVWRVRHYIDDFLYKLEVYANNNGQLGRLIKTIIFNNEGEVK